VILACFGVVVSRALKDSRFEGRDKAVLDRRIALEGKVRSCFSRLEDFWGPLWKVDR